MLFATVYQQAVLSGCNAYMLKTWRLRTRPFTQALHCIISVGATISPLIVRSFVTLDRSSNITAHVDNTSVDYYANTTDLPMTDVLDISTQSPQTVGSMQLFYPFFIGTLFTIVAAVFYTLLLVVDIRRYSKSRKANRALMKSFIKHQGEDRKKLQNVGIMAVMVVIVMVYGGMEYTYGSWIIMFSFKYLGVSFSTASFIASVYWGSFAGGRALSIVTAKFISPAKTLAGCFVLSTTALVLLTFLCTAHIAVTWTCSVIIGATFAPIFGNCLTFTQKEVNMPSNMTTVFVFSLYLGLTAMPALVGYLFTSVSPITFIYVVTVGGVIISTLFAAVLTYRQCFIRRNRP